jgi:hypothetical protein
MPLRLGPSHAVRAGGATAVAERSARSWHGAALPVGLRFPQLTVPLAHRLCASLTGVACRIRAPLAMTEAY